MILVTLKYCWLCSVHFVWCGYKWEVAGNSVYEAGNALTTQPYWQARFREGKIYI